MEITSFKTDGSKAHENVHCNFCTTVQKQELVVSKEDLAKIQVSVATCRFCALILGGSEAVSRSLYPKFADNGVRADKSSGGLVLTERNYSRAPKKFSFYTLPGTETDRWPYIPISQHRPHNSNSPQTFQIMRQWIKDCDESHSCKGSKLLSSLPKRVVDVGSDNTQPQLYESAGEKARYACLSHCWGRTQIIRTLTSNLESHKKSIPWSSLSKTFQDAIKITRELGLRYLWIDSLCIIQDSVSDWENQAAVMGDIYSGSYITIAATWSADGSGGCFSNRNAFEAYSEVIISHFDANQSSGGIFIRERPLHDARPGGNDRPLNTRAWVMQEYYLPSRIVKFDDTEIIFECITERRCECGEYDLEDVGADLKSPIKPWGIEIALKSKKTFQRWPDENEVIQSLTWLLAVQSFLARDVTYESDRLPAISALAKNFLGHNMGNYLAGLWENHLRQHLLWYKQRGNSWSGRHEVYCAPSWSWAATHGGRTVYPDLPSNGVRNRDDHMYECTILEAACCPAGPDSTGRVLSGYVIIRGLLRKTSLDDLRTLKRTEGHWEHAMHFYPDVVSEETYPKNRFYTNLLDSEQTAVEGQTTLFCLKIRTRPQVDSCVPQIQSLVLVQSSGEKEEYSRVGYITHNIFDETQKLWWEGAKETEASII
ncbi:heterokaryon incompatibility protein-domain-containing protein [Leptodontidium sp. 2 PMI_412]|nr:heterokaryon incompatibility protein-domain-containing protein [Leptodontidium sp. 2 PMI_412]